MFLVPVVGECKLAGPMSHPRDGCPGIRSEIFAIPFEIEYRHIFGISAEVCLVEQRGGSALSSARHITASELCATGTPVSSASTPSETNLQGGPKIQDHATAFDHESQSHSLDLNSFASIGDIVRSRHQYIQLLNVADHGVCLAGLNDLF